METGNLFQYEGNYPEDILWNRLFPIELTNATEHGYAVSHGLRYVVVEKVDSSYGATAYTSSGNTYCPLLASAPLTCELVFDGNSMALFRLYL